MSIQGLGWAYKQDIKPAAAKFVLVTLANYADEHGVCYPSQAKLAKDTGQSVRSVREHLAYLERAGLITRATRRRNDGSYRSDNFFLNWSEEDSGIAGETETGTERPAAKSAAGTPPAANIAAGPAAKSAGHEPKQELTETKKYTPEFEEWWLAYPRKPNMSKLIAGREFQKALRDTPHCDLIAALEAYKLDLAAESWRKPAHAATWLNQRRWEGFLAPPDPGQRELTEAEKLEMRRQYGLEAA